MSLERRVLRLIVGLVLLGVLVAISFYRPGRGPADGPTGQPSTTATSPATPAPSTATSVGSTPSGSTIGSPGPTGAPADVAGTWSGTWTSTTPEAQTGSLSLSLTQSGLDLGGEIVMADNPCYAGGAVRGGLAGGSAIELRNSGRDEVEFSGSLAGDRLSGTFSMSCDNSMGTWLLERTN